jgi:hypothetical protein
MLTGKISADREVYPATGKRLREVSIYTEALKQPPLTEGARCLFTFYWFRVSDVAGLREHE